MWRIFIVVDVDIDVFEWVSLLTSATTTTTVAAAAAATANQKQYVGGTLLFNWKVCSWMEAERTNDAQTVSWLLSNVPLKCVKWQHLPFTSICLIVHYLIVKTFMGLTMVYLKELSLNVISGLRSRTWSSSTWFNSSWERCHFTYSQLMVNRINIKWKQFHLNHDGNETS